MKIVFYYAQGPRVLSGEVSHQDLTNKMLAVAPMFVMGAAPGMSAKIANASQPIKDLLLGLADPVCYIVFAWGLLECMLGKSGSGIQRMKYATLGYLGMNWIPEFMAVLQGARP